MEGWKENWSRTVESRGGIGVYVVFEIVWTVLELL